MSGAGREPVTGTSSSRIVASAAHCPYGRRDAISHSTSRSASTHPRSRSTIHSAPGFSRPRRTTRSGSTGIAPLSDASTTQPSSVCSQRPGRSPLRSSLAPSIRPSLNVIDAGPSHGSISFSW